MDLIQRPKEVAKSDRGYMTNEQYQDYAQQQFKIIYDKIDEIIKTINS